MAMNTRPLDLARQSTGREKTPGPSGRRKEEPGPLGRRKGRSPGRPTTAAQLARWWLTVESLGWENNAPAPAFGETPLRLIRPARRTNPMRGAPPHADGNAIRSVRGEARPTPPREENPRPGPACRRGSAVRAVGPFLFPRLRRASRAQTMKVGPNSPAIGSRPFGPGTGRNYSVCARKGTN